MTSKEKQLQKDDDMDIMPEFMKFINGKHFKVTKSGYGYIKHCLQKCYDRSGGYPRTSDHPLFAHMVLELTFRFPNETARQREVRFNEFMKQYADRGKVL